VNIAELPGSISLFDVLVLFVLMAMLILGFMQGSIRRMLGIAALLFSFLVAANLRDPLGGFFASHWTHLPQTYSYMIAFGTIFLVLALGLALASQIFYKKTVLAGRYPALDPTLGATLGLVQGALLVGIGIVILDSYFGSGLGRQPNELPLLREIFTAMEGSATAGIFRSSLIPGVLAIVGVFVPTAITSSYPRA
jgi:uncharacterized membrane protein required for colicin V production